MIPLTLHIGTPKTATTSIQESLWLNRQALEDQGTVFCHNLGQTNNIDLFLACLHHNEGGFGILENRGVIGQAAREEFRLDVTKRLHANTISRGESDKTKRLIGSSEHMWFMWSNVHFRNLKTILEGAKVKLQEVIVYLRPQSELLYSALSTMVRDGFCIDDIDVSHLDNHEFKYLHYYDRLSAWKVNFPDAFLKVYLFNDHKKQIINHFYSACSLPNINTVDPPVMNESLSDMGVAILAELNRRFLAELTRHEVVRYLKEDNTRSRLGKLIELHFPGKPTPTMEVVEAINQYYQQDNKTLIDEYFPERSLTDLCPRPTRFADRYAKSASRDDAKGVIEMLLSCMEESSTSMTKLS